MNLENVIPVYYGRYRFTYVFMFLIHAEHEKQVNKMTIWVEI